MIIPRQFTMRHFFSLVIMAHLLVGCSGQDEETKLRSFIQSVKSRASGPIEPIPTYKPLAQFLYPETTVRRSPFHPKRIKVDKNRYAPNINRVKQVLEHFPLDALRFVGVLRQSYRIWGLIQLPSDGEIKRIKVGDYMGLNYGKVKSINSKSIVLEERVNVGGRWEKKLTKVLINSQGKE